MKHQQNDTPKTRTSSYRTPYFCILFISPLGHTHLIPWIAGAPNLALGGAAKKFSPTTQTIGVALLPPANEFDTK
jgi:hypothetical protein